MIEDMTQLNFETIQIYFDSTTSKKRNAFRISGLPIRAYSNQDDTFELKYLEYIRLHSNEESPRILLLWGEYSKHE